MLPSQAPNTAAESASSTGTGGSDSPPIVLTPTSSPDSSDNVVHNTTDASREVVANETNMNYPHYRADGGLAGHFPIVNPYLMPPRLYGTTYPDFSGRNFLNWQPYPVLPQEYEPGVETCSNIACEGTNQAGVGVKDMEFRTEQERRLYLDGWGLPKGGFDVEERLLRAINMNHYILVGHIDKTSREIRTEQRTIEQKLHMMERKIQKANPQNLGHPSLASPSHSPQDTAIENGYSVKRLDLAITQLWAHVDKLKSANELLLEEKVERKELEEILATELLYHNHTMERMQAKISSMTKEVTCCWTEIRKLQDSVKRLESGAIGKKLPPRSIFMNEGNSMPSTLSCRMVSTQKALEKINEELERLKNDRNHTLCADPTHATHCEGARQKSPLTTENEDECDCDLCGKAREWTSAGIGKRDESVVRKVSSLQESGSVEARGNCREKPNTHNEISSGPPRTCNPAYVSVAWYLEFLNVTLIDYTLITNVTPNSHALQMWCSAYESMRLEDQKVIAMELFNGDVILCLAVPNKEGKVINTHIKELKEDLAAAAVKSIFDLRSRKLKSKEGSMSNNCLGTNEVSSYPANRVRQGPQPETGLFHLLTSTAASNSATASAGETTDASPSTVVPTTIGFSGKPTKQTNTQPFAPLPDIARTTIPGRDTKEKPKFGTYGFPWLEQGQVEIDWKTYEDKDRKEWDGKQKLELGGKACERCADGTAESAVDLLSKVDAALATMRARKHQYDQSQVPIISKILPKKVEVEDVREESDVEDKDMAKGKERRD